MNDLMNSTNGSWLEIYRLAFYLSTKVHLKSLPSARYRFAATSPVPNKNERFWRYLSPASVLLFDIVFCFHRRSSGIVPERHQQDQHQRNPRAILLLPKRPTGEVLQSVARCRLNHQGMDIIIRAPLQTLRRRSVEVRLTGATYRGKDHVALDRENYQR